MGDEELQIEIIDDGTSLPGDEAPDEMGAEFALSELLGEPIEDEDSP